MKFYAADYRTENNIYSPLLISYENFEECVMMRNGEISTQGVGFRPVIRRFRELAERDGHEIIMGIETIAAASGLVVKTDYERIRDEILGDIKAAMPLDAVMLQLHGAMAAVGYEDCEGDILSRIRSIVGPNVPVGVELDPHAHLTDAMVKGSPLLVFYKHQPHMDYTDRADDIYKMCVDQAQGRIKPVASVFDCRMLGGINDTTTEPMKGFIGKIESFEGKNNVLSISVVHGYPLADNPDMGVKVLVITDDNKAHGDKLAEELGLTLYDMITNQEQTSPFGHFLEVEEAIDKAIENYEKFKEPIVMAEAADTVGGGAPGDSTWFLKGLIERNVPGTIYKQLWDPLAVPLLFKIGVGQTVDVRIGGRYGYASGPPLDVTATVTGLYTAEELKDCGAYSSDVAVIRVSEVDIVLTENRAGYSDKPTVQDHFPDYARIGLDAANARILGIKSVYPYRPENPSGIMVATDGALAAAVTRTPTKIRLPIWPLDSDPFA
ncbi:MAG: M81 family metallopeptidase [Deltaproteobacteria bacterium]|nr:M81 family metallopeptidase [Deltaproteobacteria bacterium]